MVRLSEHTSWKALEAHAARPDATDILGLFATDSDRAKNFTLEAAGLTLDYSKNPISDETLKLLLSLAEHSSLPAQLKAMFDGRRINVTENRSVLHIALRNRSQRPILVGKSVV